MSNIALFEDVVKAVQQTQQPKVWDVVAVKDERGRCMARLEYLRMGIRAGRPIPIKQLSETGGLWFADADQEVDYFRDVA